MVDVGVVAPYIADVKSTRFWYLLDKVEHPTGPWQAGKNQQEAVLRTIGNRCPIRRNRDVFGVYETGAGPRCLVDKESGLPNANQHILPPVSEVAVDVDVRILEC